MIHKVLQGECLLSISGKYGFLPETIWNHPANLSLKRDRGNYRVLYPGDEIFIPERQIKEEMGATESRHKFRRKNMPVYLHLQLLNENREPLANKPYTLQVEGKFRQGRTDEEGRIKEPIYAQEREGVLTIEGREFNVRLGYLNPHDYNSGVRSRLNNLGYKAGSGGEEMDASLRRAIEAFQEDQGLPKTGELNEATRAALLSSHKF